MCLALVLTLAAFGCDETPGPGTYLITVSGGAAAAVLEVEGAGVTAIEPIGDARTYSARTSSGAGWRVVLSASGAGDLGVRVLVEDRQAGGPTVRVLEAADDRNLPLSPSVLRVHSEED